MYRRDGPRVRPTDVSASSSREAWIQQRFRQSLLTYGVTRCSLPGVDPVASCIGHTEHSGASVGESHPSSFETEMCVWKPVWTQGNEASRRPSRGYRSPDSV